MQFGPVGQQLQHAAHDKNAVTAGQPGQGTVLLEIVSSQRNSVFLTSRCRCSCCSTKLVPIAISRLADLHMPAFSHRRGSSSPTVAVRHFLKTTDCCWWLCWHQSAALSCGQQCLGCSEKLYQGGSSGYQLYLGCLKEGQEGQGWSLHTFHCTLFSACCCISPNMIPSCIL